MDRQAYKRVLRQVSRSKCVCMYLHMKDKIEVKS